MSTQNSTVSKLASAAHDLNQIVEGIISVRWAFDGKRLKDTPQWCAFYSALREFERADSAPVPTPLFDGLDALLEAASENPLAHHTAIKTALERIAAATAEQIAAEIRTPSSNVALFRQFVRDESLARILTASAL